MILLQLEALRLKRGETAVIDGISLTVRTGECVGLIGPNGAGKTTLMRAALGLLPHEGRSSLAVLPPVERARQAAFLPQSREIAWPVTVEAVVALGRAPHPARRAAAAADRAAIDHALARMGLAEFRNRRATALSGGEQARVLIARALAQETPLLLADEPVAGLDPEAQLRTMQVLSDLATAGQGVVVSLHDLGLAARFCTRLVMLDHGRIVADGPPAAVLADDLLAQVFGIRGYHADTPDGPVFQPLAVTR